MKSRYHKLKKEIKGYESFYGNKSHIVERLRQNEWRKYLNWLQREVDKFFPIKIKKRKK